jgi:hypothetical protein
MIFGPFYIIKFLRSYKKTGKMTKRKQDLCQQKENAKLFADAETSSKYTSETFFGLNHRETVIVKLNLKNPY